MRPAGGAERRQPADTAPGEPASAGRRLAFLYVVYWCTVAVAKFGARLSGPLSGRLKSFADDAYYYFQIAFNVAHGAGSSFNGIDSTNGYHPAWLGVLSVVATLTDDKRTFLLLVGGLLLVIWAATLWLTYQLGVATGRMQTVALAALPGLFYGVYATNFVYDGMEVALVVMLLVAVTVVTVRGGLMSASPPTRRVALKAGALLAALFLARLDTVVFSALYVAAAAFSWRGHGRRAVRPLLLLAAPLGSVGVVYAALNQLWFGTPVPVSGQAKALGGGDLRLSLFTTYLRFGRFHGVPMYLGLVTAGLGVLALVSLLRRHVSGTPMEAICKLLFVALAAQAAELSYYTVTSSWYLWEWYYYLSPIVVLLASIALLDAARALLPSPRRTFGALLVLGALSVAVLGALDARAQLVHPPSARANPIAFSARFAGWIDDHLPAGSAFAMGNVSGAIGYESRRPLVQLEGLVESKSYLDALRAGRVPAFFARRRVELVVRVGGPESATPVAVPGRSCRAYPEPMIGTGPKARLILCDEDLVLHERLLDGSQLFAWRYDPKFNRDRAPESSSRS